MTGSRCRRRLLTPPLLAACALWADLAAEAAAQGNAASDRAVIEALYDATDGPNWIDNTNWKTASPLGEWFGVTTDTAGRVTRLQLPGNELAGPIPATLGELSLLRNLDLGIRWDAASQSHKNALTGPIPPALGRLVNLAVLDLSANGLTGPIPAELGNLVNLEWISLGKNYLTGSVPSELGNLANLERLSLGWNGLTGPVPAELGSLANLRTLYLLFNPLTETLPESLAELSQLRRLDISRTGACAPADAEFQAWLAALDYFRGDTCNRPPEAVGAAPAQTLAEAGPAVGLSVADWFSDPDDDPLAYSAASTHAGTVTALVSGDTIWLVPGSAGTSTVTVTASDPDGLSAAQAVAVTTTASSGPQSDREVLELLYDGTGGPGWTNGRNWKTAAPLGEWHGVATDAAGRVTELRLGLNGLAGPIPAALGRLANLAVLNLDSNALIGPVPSWLGPLTALRSLSLGGNELTGPVPASLGRLTALRSLSLSSNALTGSLPGELGGLANLWSLNLRGNELSGPIPGELSGLTNLRWLHLDGNELSGPVPDELGRLTNLRSLYLDGNELSGPIPDELGRLTSLERLSLDHNWGVTGELPSGLLELPSLKALDFVVTQACAPAAWRDRLASMEFTGRPCESGTDVTVDVAAVYTPAAREAVGGAAAIAAVIDLMVAETNQAYAASGVHHRLRLVERSEVSYVETGNSIDLRRLADPSDGHMDAVHALRDRVGADLVHLIVDESDVGGGAFILSAFGLSKQSAGGRTFAHELGHNMGLRHDRYQAHHNEDGTRPHPAYGYVNQPALAAGAARSRRWRTIMAYAYQCADAYIICSTPLRFSNPRQRYNGDLLGVPFSAGGSGVNGPADAAGVLNATGPMVALWRDRVPGSANRPPRAVGTLPDRTLTLNSTVNVDVSEAFVDPDGDALSYTVSSSAPHVATMLAAGTRVTVTGAGAGTATLRVTATDTGGLSANQSFTVTVTVIESFTDDPIVAGVTPIKAVHFAELRTRIDGLRTTVGLRAYAWTDPVLSAGSTQIKLAHLTEMRLALAPVFMARGWQARSWTDATPTTGRTPIRAAHLTELRAAVVALE